VVRRRVDAELVRRGLVASWAEAQEAVRAGRVLVRGAPATKTSTLVGADDPVALAGPPRRFVSRGGEKLAAALDAFAIDVVDRDALDAGASTGGFTDCLLQRSARRVVAVDVGHAQLAWELRTDPRVTVLERTNVRDLGTMTLPFVPTIVVADLSFISLRTVVPALAAIAAADADLVLLVKPQFEARRERVGAGGVVRDPAEWRRAVASVVEAVEAAGATPIGVIASPITGPAGNVEFLLHARRGDGGPPVPIDLDAAIAVGEALARR
jgi:23S rRNA (cytidine1920-2'-O)/16S rRNA (cytidine1409-2'-O)-methyltransferase